MASLPPKQAPVGEVAAFANPFTVLLRSKSLSKEQRESLEQASVEYRSQLNLVAAKIRTLESQVQHLLAQYDWTKVRP